MVAGEKILYRFSRSLNEIEVSSKLRGNKPVRLNIPMVTTINVYITMISDCLLQMPEMQRMGPHITVMSAIVEVYQVLIRAREAIG